MLHLIEQFIRQRANIRFICSGIVNSLFTAISNSAFRWRNCGRAFTAFNVPAELTELQRTTMPFTPWTFVDMAFKHPKFSLYSETNSSSR